MSFAKLLIANRGEIACRVIATARELGYRTVAVYSAADADAPHVHLADQAVLIGPAPAADSYLKAESIIAAAKRTGADAIHPGYGFLSENAEFAEACAENDIIFVGPPVAAIRLMGNKRLSKIHMRGAGVSCVPGYDGEDQSDDRLLREADSVGFPLMVKAAAGGGGRGMRLVTTAEDLAAAIASARSEAENAFGSGELILEKAVIAPRHVEIQVFADSHGNVIHLGERDCSIQRRHQKVIEEAPSPAVTPEIRAAMGAAAVAAAASVGYVGAGTVEFLLEGSGAFYFLEMNTRLQVEHPVTEEIIGEDLVAWQLDIAAGGVLPLAQHEVGFFGHAIEARLYAEDPYENFMPQTGRIAAWRPSADVRVDHGIAEGQEITPYYDSMLAKIIAHGATREEARRKLIRALEDSPLLGVKTNAAYLVALLRHPAFIEGAATTAFIPEYFPAEKTMTAPPSAVVAVLAAALIYMRDAAGMDGWRSSMPAVCSIKLALGGAARRVEITPLGRAAFDVTVMDDEVAGAEASRQNLLILDDDDGELRFSLDGLIDSAFYVMEGDTLHLMYHGQSLVCREITPEAAAATARPDDGRLLAPMAGRIMAVRKQQGEAVIAGDIVVILEAMKMEHEIKARGPGTLTQISVAEGDQVDPRQLLAVVEAAADDAAGKL